MRGPSLRYWCGSTVFAECLLKVVTDGAVDSLCALEGALHSVYQ